VATEEDIEFHKITKKKTIKEAKRIGEVRQDSIQGVKELLVDEANTMMPSSSLDMMKAANEDNEGAVNLRNQLGGRR